MGFHLSSLISYGTGMTPTGETSGVSDTARIQVDNGMAALKSMTPGETLQGEVIAVNGNEVELKIADNAVISAKLEQNMNVMIGQKMLFEVSNHNNGQIALRALFTNLAQEQLAQNALQAAGIQQNGQTVQMISGLMKEGMSIDTQTLQNVYHDILNFPEADQSMLIHMHKIGMETTPQNVEQFQALINYEERVANTIQELIHELPAELKNMAVNGEVNMAMAVTRELVSLIADYETDLIIQSQNSGEAGSNIESEVKAQVIDNSLAKKTDDGVIQTENEQTPLPNEPETHQQSVVEKALAILEEASDSRNQTMDLVNDKVVSGVLSKTEYMELATLLEQSGFSKELVVQMQQGKMPMQELFGMLKTELPAKEALIVAKLWDNPAFVKLMGKELQNTWLLKPTEVENGKNVTDFYNRINTQINSVISSMSQSLPENSVLAQSLQQFQENVDFLNNLNQFMPYVQLPLKMNGQSTTGDLYVYADKRSLASGKDTVSAALHLNMQHLGQVDVYVKMQNKNVSTDFCLENEATLDFIAEHIDMLSERLERRGYHLNAQMKVSDVPSSIKEGMLSATDTLSVEEKKTENAIAVYRFDVRA